MGNAPSKDGKGTPSGSQTPTGQGPALDQYPSFSKSDTRESTRSLKTALRTRIPGGGKSGDSPRSSSTNIASQADDNGSTVSGKAGQRQARATPGAPMSPQEARSLIGDDEDLQPPPSPTQGPMTGDHKAIEDAQRSGEVDAVSDAPPTGNIRPSHNAEPMPSILVKKDSGTPTPRRGGCTCNRRWGYTLTVGIERDGDRSH